LRMSGQKLALLLNNARFCSILRYRLKLSPGAPRDCFVTSVPRNDSASGQCVTNHMNEYSFLCTVYQAAIISQRELRLLGDGWLRRKQPKRQERTRERRVPNIFGRARRSDEIRAGVFAVLSGFYFIAALRMARE